MTFEERRAAALNTDAFAARLLDDGFDDERESAFPRRLALVNALLVALAFWVAGVLLLGSSDPARAVFPLTAAVVLSFCAFEVWCSGGRVVEARPAQGSAPQRGDAPEPLD